MRIYLDVDDTLAAFKAYAIERGVPPWSGTWYTTDPKTWTEEQHAIQAKTNALMREPDFWGNIPLMDGAMELVCAAAGRGEVYLLTAAPSSLPEDTWPDIARQKQEWADRMLHIPANRVIVCKRSDKVWYATDHTRNILVDDAHQNCQEWHKAGGIPILYDDHARALGELKKY